MQLKINLATKNYINAIQLNSALAITLLIMLVFLVLNVKEIAFNAGEVKRITGDISLFSEKSKVSAKGIPESEYKYLLERIRFANSIIEKKTVNWLQLFDWLEAVVPEGVAISMIEPDIKVQMLKLSGTARNFKNIRRLLENMENSQHFFDVYLLSQSETKNGLGQKGIAFTISSRTVYK